MGSSDPSHNTVPADPLLIWFDAESGPIRRDRCNIGGSLLIPLGKTNLIVCPVHNLCQFFFEIFIAAIVHLQHDW